MRRCSKDYIVLQTHTQKFNVEYDEKYLFDWVE